MYYKFKKRKRKYKLLSNLSIFLKKHFQSPFFNEINFLTKRMDHQIVKQQLQPLTVCNSCFIYFQISSVVKECGYPKAF
jgi:hypothetical protein